MFLVDDTLEKRQAYIKRQLKYDPILAVFLAAADFEWTIRRAILALGRNPTKYIREEVLGNCSGLKAYKDAWKKEAKPICGDNLADVVPDWQFFKEAYKLRHRLIHGVIGTTGNYYATVRVNAILAASKSIADYASSKNEPLFGRKIIRRKPR